MQQSRLWVALANKNGAHSMWEIINFFNIFQFFIISQIQITRQKRKNMPKPLLWTFASSLCMPKLLVISSTSTEFLDLYQQGTQPCIKDLRRHFSYYYGLIFRSENIWIQLNSDHLTKVINWAAIVNILISSFCK